MASAKLKVAYVFRWAGTGEILEVHDAEVDEGGWLWHVREDGPFHVTLHVPKTMWARTLDEAQAGAKRVREKRVASLRKQLRKAEALAAVPAAVKVRE